jgi:hypothetical protein
MTDVHHTGILRRRWAKVLAWIFVIGTFIGIAERAIAILLHLGSRREPKTKITAPKRLRLPTNCLILVVSAIS